MNRDGDKARRYSTPFAKRCSETNYVVVHTFFPTDGKKIAKDRHSSVHVTIHLPEEALLVGPVNYRWMYPIERAKPEGSIIEAWAQYESLTFCGMYLKDVDTAFNRPQRNNGGGLKNEKLSVFAQSARPFEDPVRGESFSRNDMEVAHWFVLNNCDEIMAYLDEHEEMMKREHPSHLYAMKYLKSYITWRSARFALNYSRVAMLTASSFWGLHEMTSCVRKTLRGTNFIQESFQLQGVFSIEIPIQSITIDLGNLPRYEVPMGQNNESDEEEDWETESDDSEDNETYYSLDDD
ncbi:unnamed protein product [Prunus armeniaca]